MDGRISGKADNSFIILNKLLIISYIYFKNLKYIKNE